jgi:hypothetical protein
MLTDVSRKITKETKIDPEQLLDESTKEWLKKKNAEKKDIDDLCRNITFSQEEDKHSKLLQDFLSQGLDGISFCTQFKEGKKKVGTRSGRLIFTDHNSNELNIKEKKIYEKIYSEQNNIYEPLTQKVKSDNFIKGLNYETIKMKSL